MKAFLDDDFILQGEVARVLFHKYAEHEMIFDFHNHLIPQEIFENRPLGNLANAWLDHDHYKWRAMRAAGFSEDIITGHLNADGSVKSFEERGGREVCEKKDYERYLAFVQTLQLCVGNPLYHWSHLELLRYFDINEPLTLDNARAVWDRCNALLKKSEYAPRGLLKKLGVKQLCTTDDPLDNLEWHKKIAEECRSSTSNNDRASDSESTKDGANALSKARTSELEFFDVKVRPSFRPDFIINAESPDFPSYVSRLQEMSGKKFLSIMDMLWALEQRMDYFKSNGSLVSDHSLENDFYLPASYDDVNYIFEKAWIGKKLSHEELAKYKGWVLIELGKLYAKKGFVMQLHIGALRDNNSFLFEKKGKNIGLDSLQDFNYAPQLSSVLDGIYSASQAEGFEPKVILYNLNPRDNEAIATMAANFRNCQAGPAWWFNDHKDGIEEQIKVYARTAPLGKYVGMLTDSRSFLSYPRHEYFRRILCNFIGNLVESGEFPWNEKLLGGIVKNICYKNSIDFFGAE